MLLWELSSSNCQQIELSPPYPLPSAHSCAHSCHNNLLGCLVGFVLGGGWWKTAILWIPASCYKIWPKEIIALKLHVKLPPNWESVLKPWSLSLVLANHKVNAKGSLAPVRTSGCGLLPLLCCFIPFSVFLCLWKLCLKLLLNLLSCWLESACWPSSVWLSQPSAITIVQKCNVSLLISSLPP